MIRNWTRTWRALALPVLLTLALAGVLVFVRPSAAASPASSGGSVTAGTATPLPTLPPPPTQPPSTTAPCSPGEIFADMQGWWVNPDPAKNRGHLHVSVCFPHGKTLSGKLTFRVRTVMHQNPGSLNRISIHVVAPKVAGAATCGGNDALACVSLPRPRTLATCAATAGILSPDGMTCTWWDTLSVDTALVAVDGWQEFRFKASVNEPDGKRMLVSNGLHAYIKNGHPVDNLYPNWDSMTARGWYTNAGYTNATLAKPPTGPVSGLWQPTVKLDQGSGGLPVIGHYAALDTDFHNGNPGIPLHSGSGPYRGTLQIDTTKLSNGWHRLFLKTDALDKASGSTSSGVLAIYFEVRN